MLCPNPGSAHTIPSIFLKASPSKTALPLISNYLITPDQYSPHPVGTAGNEDWANGEWSLTVKGPNWGPKEFKGFWSAVHVLEGNVWKNRMVIGNITPAPAAAPSPTATPSNK
jgi:uncharacterized protein (TIGR02246 family)